MAFNATAAAAAHATAHQLYAHVDLSKLSWLEQFWAAWYIWIDNPVIATGLMSFLLHEVSCTPGPTRRSLTPIQDCIFRTLCSLDHHRRYAVLSKVETATQQDPYSPRTMGVYQAGPFLPFYHRIACCQFRRNFDHSNVLNHAF